MRHRHNLSLLCFVFLLGLDASAAPAEDWTTPKVNRDTLTAEKPTVGEHSDLPSLTTELVRVEWRRGDPIYLHVMIPKLVSNPPVILYLYNYDSDIDRFQDAEFDKALTARGVAAVGFVAALSGHRYHDRPMKQWFVSELQESLASTAHDVQMIIDYLATRHDIDPSRVGMLGLGSGGSVAVLAASADPRIKAIGLINPWGDWPDWVHETRFIPKAERPSFETKAFLSSVEPLDPIRYLPQLKGAVGLEFLNYKGAIPEPARAKMEASAPPEAVIVPTEKALADYEDSSSGAFINWLKDQLLGTEPTTPPVGH